jgi:hypothetical protein
LPAPSCATSGRTETATQGARIIVAIDEFNRHPVVHTWSYKLDTAA